MKPETRLVHLARGERVPEGTVNLPVSRASTIVSPDLESYLERHAGERRYEKVTYGATGTHNARALARAMATLEGAHGAVVTASGLSAVVHAIGAFVATGDHVLVSDSVYWPTRRYCDEVLARFGIETTYFDPTATPEALDALIREKTRLVYLEAPGSLTFDMQDIPGLAAAARARGVLSLMDNTWASPLYFRPIEHGVDVSIQGGTKYLAGHSDLVIGVISARDEPLHRRIADHVWAHGDVCGPDDCYLTLRGLRTLGVRLPRQSASALRVAAWLAARPEVRRVLYPPLPDDPGHALWKRDFDGAGSLFGVVLDTADRAAMSRMVDGLELFAIGSSWGGYESLVSATPTPLPRAVHPWAESPLLLRLHVGLEDPDDLIADLQAGLGRL